MSINETLTMINQAGNILFIITIFLVLIVLFQLLNTLLKFAQSTVKTLAPLENTVTKLENISQFTTEFTSNLESIQKKFNRAVSTIHTWHVIKHFFGLDKKKR